MFRRKIIQNIEIWLEEKEFIILNWPRQVWKTSILKILKSDLERNKNKCFYLDLEDNLILETLNENPENLLDFYSDFNNLKNWEKIYFFIDEIQYLDKASNFLKFIFDKYSEKIKIICSWSSALELKAEFQDSLAWRKISFNIRPLDFFEFLDFKNFEYKNFLNSDLEKNIPKNIQFELNRFLKEFLIFWWMPAVVLKKNIQLKKDLLREYVNTYINKDIRAIWKIENISTFNKFLKLSVNQIWNLLNLNEISNTLWFSRTLAKKYLDLLNYTFVLNQLNPYSKNVRSQITKMSKIYFFDLWVRNQILNNFVELDSRSDSWAIFENFIFNELFSFYEKNMLFFYRTTTWSEIDFILDDWQKILPVELKFSEFSKFKWNRALTTFVENLKSEKWIMLNLNYNKNWEKIEFLDYLRFLIKIKK